MKKKTEGIKITGYKQLGFTKPVAEKKEQRHIWVISSVDARKSTKECRANRPRAWSIWGSQKAAITDGVFGWDDAEYYYESGYYTHVVVEKFMLNHPLPITIDKDSQKWFRLVAGPMAKNGFRPVKAVPCKRPKKYAHVVGFL